jgi:hypothetical protein
MILWSRLGRSRLLVSSWTTQSTPSMLRVAAALLRRQLRPPSAAAGAKSSCPVGTRAERYGRNTISDRGNRPVTRSMQLPLGSKSHDERWHGSSLERGGPACAARRAARCHAHGIDDRFDTHRPNRLPHPVLQLGTISSGLVVTPILTGGSCASPGNCDPIVQRI